MSPLVLAASRHSALVLAEAGAPGTVPLSPAEEERRARLRRPSDREDFQAAHLLIRQMAGRLLGVPGREIAIRQRCATCGGPHGRPEIVGHPGIGASLAHSHGVVAAAAGTVPVGIDVELLAGTDGLAAGDLAVALTPAERAAIDAAADRRRALLTAWVRKEACLKAGLVDLDGLGAFDLSALPFDLLSGDHAVRSSEHRGWTVHDWWDGRIGAVGAVVAPVGTEIDLAQ